MSLKYVERLHDLENPTPELLAQWRGIMGRVKEQKEGLLDHMRATNAAVRPYKAGARVAGRGWTPRSRTCRELSYPPTASDKAFAAVVRRKDVSFVRSMN